MLGVSKFENTDIAATFLYSSL